MIDVNYAADREFGDKFMPEVKSILGQLLFTTDYEQEDTDHNTDLIVLKMGPSRIGVRIRRYGYWKYNDEFSIRYSKASKAETEFIKIMQGWGDYFFYGFADEDETHLIKWTLGDFNAFRKYITEQMILKKGCEFLNEHRHTVHINGDTFLAFKWSEVSKFAIADSGHWQEERIYGIRKT